MFRSLISVASLVLITSCGGDSRLKVDSQDQLNSENQQFIRGGKEVKEEQKDFRNWSTIALTTDMEMVPVSKGSEEKVSPLSLGKSFCSGTLVHKRVVVTAAHCVRKMDRKTGKFTNEYSFEPENFIVSFDNKVSEDGNWVRAEAVYAANRWNSKTTTTPTPKKPPHDIAVIILEDEAPSDVARPIPIADKKYKIKKGQTIYAVGYGVSSSRNKNDTGILRQVKTPVRVVDDIAWRISAKGATDFGDQERQEEEEGINEGDNYDEGDDIGNDSSSSGGNEGVDEAEGEAGGSGGIFGQILGELFGGFGICGGDSGGPAYMLVNGKLRLFGAASIGLDLMGMKCLGHGTYTDVRYYKTWIHKLAASHDIDMGDGINKSKRPDKTEKPKAKSSWTLNCKNADGEAFVLENLSKSKAIFTPKESGILGSAMEFKMKTPKNLDKDSVNAFTFSNEEGDHSVRLWIPGIEFDASASADLEARWIKDAFSKEMEVINFKAGECKIQ